MSYQRNRKKSNLNEYPICITSNENHNIFLCNPPKWEILDVQLSTIKCQIYCTEFANSWYSNLTVANSEGEYEHFGTPNCSHVVLTFNVRRHASVWVWKAIKCWHMEHRIDYEQNNFITLENVNQFATYADTDVLLIKYMFWFSEIICLHLEMNIKATYFGNPVLPLWKNSSIEESKY